MIKLLALVVLLQSCYGFEIDPKIINGRLSPENAFPFYQFLAVEHREENAMSSCGSSLISDRWIITAAHCLAFKLPLNVYLGVNRDGKFMGSIPIPVEDQIIHPEYNNETHMSDIALIRLAQPIQINHIVHPVKLPTDCGEDLDNASVLAAGNGQRSFNHRTQMDTRLEYVFLKTTTDNECTRLSKSFDRPGSIICAHPNGDGGSIAQGDSGGPLLRASDQTLIGLTSAATLQRFQLFFYKKVNVQHLEFTKIHYHFDWISSVTGIPLPTCKHAEPIQSTADEPAPSPWSGIFGKLFGKKE